MFDCPVIYIPKNLFCTFAKSNLQGAHKTVINDFTLERKQNSFNLRRQILCSACARELLIPFIP